MHPTFERFLDPIRDTGLSRGERSFYAYREIMLTNQATAELKSKGDVQGVKFGEEYLRVLNDLIAKEGLTANAHK